MLVRVDACPYGPRLFLLNHRIHHWHWGCALIALGSWLIGRDWPDVPVPHRH